MRTSLTLLSPVVVAHDHVQHDVKPSRPALLLLYLAVTGNWVSRETLTNTFRSDDVPMSRSQLRLLLTRARQFPWAAELEADPLRVRWLTTSDLQAFRSAVQAADWSGALAAYQAPLLVGLPTQERHLPGFHEWLQGERAALHRQWLQAAEHEEKRLVNLELYAEAAQLFARALRFDPLSEQVLQRYLQLSLLAGQREEALQTYLAYEKRLRRELGLSPAPETSNLVQLLRQAVGGARAETGPKTDSRANSPRQPEIMLAPPVFQGREAELSHVRLATTMLLVSGEAGLGKSALLAQAQPNWPVIRILPGQENILYAPLLQYLREKWPNWPELGPYAPDLKAMLPLLGLNSQVMEDEGESGKIRFYEGLTRFFEAQSGQYSRRAGIILDDLQWADSGTLDWLSFLVRTQRLCVLGSRRTGPGETGHLQTLLLELGNAVEHLALEPLGQVELSAMIEQLSGRADLAKQLTALLTEKSGGNPLLALEYLRSLWEQGHSGAWELKSEPLDIPSIPLTPRLNDLILARLQRLDYAHRRVLEVACVLGGQLVPTQLAAVLGESVWSVSESLGQAERAGLLRAGRFAHDLTRQVLYDALPAITRTAIHGEIARQLEGVIDDFIRAEHAFKAGEEALAGQLWFNATYAAFGDKPYFEEEAAQLYARVVDLTIRTPEWFRAAAHLAARYRGTAHNDRALELISTIIAQSPDPHARAIAFCESAMQAYMSGNLTQASEKVELAAREARKTGLQPLIGDVLLMQTAIAQYRGDHQFALQVCETIVEQQRSESPSLSRCTWHSALASSLCAVGRPEEALTHYHEQLRLAQILGLRGQQVIATADIVATLEDLGRLEEGVPLAEQALTLGEYNNTSAVRNSLAQAYCQQGRLEEALAQTEQVLMHGKTVNSHAYALAVKLETLCKQGQSSAVQLTATKALEIAEHSDAPSIQAVILTAALRFSHGSARLRALELARTIDQNTLPAYLLGGFQAALDQQTQG